MPKTKGRTAKTSGRRPKTRSSTRSSATPRPPARIKSSHAREPITDAEIEAAKTWEERGLVCLRVLSEGGWDAQVPRLLRLWGCTEPVLSTYKRAGRVALAAISGDDAAKRLEDVLAELRVETDTHRRIAADYRARGRLTLATKHDDLARKALEDFAQVGGLLQHRVVHSVETDPRIAGMYQAILAALEDRDRQEGEREQRLGAWVAEVEQRLVAWVAEVEKLTGGVLPPGCPVLPPGRPEALPSVRGHVRDAVKRYEGEIGARAEMRKLAA